MTDLRPYETVAEHLKLFEEAVTVPSVSFVRPPPPHAGAGGAGHQRQDVHEHLS